MRPSKFVKGTGALSKGVGKGFVAEGIVQEGDIHLLEETRTTTMPMLTLCQCLTKDLVTVGGLQYRQHLHHSWV
jgi:hypothetical protein